MQFSNNENKHCNITETLTYNENNDFIKFTNSGITGLNTGFHVFNNNKQETNIEQVSLINNCLNIGTHNETNKNNLFVKDGAVSVVSTITNDYPLRVEGFKKLDTAFSGFRYNTGINTGSTNDARGIFLTLSLSNSLQMGEGEIYSSSDKRIKKNFSLTQPLESLNIVNSIELYKYNYITSPDEPKVYGYMAQQVENLIPTAVLTTENTVNGVDIDDFKILKKDSINVVHHDAIRQLYKEYIELENEQKQLINQLQIIKQNL